ncbi:MAG: SpaA isopeptide-forming pilin-related protein [Candidatus Faecousia sp.]|nr:SpaA isopeptide-forming pilin-related protein [Candidatus Faecousia sp.]
MYRVKGNTDWLCYGGKGLPADGNWNGHTADGGCLLKTMTRTGPGNDQQIWPLVPKFNREGQVLEYTVVEHPLSGYDFDGGADKQRAQPSAFQAVLNLFRTAKTAPDAYEAANSFTYTNIELQDYKVQKVWQTTDYAQKAPDGTYTATFRLEQKVGDGDWIPVEGRDPISLTAAYADIASGKEISGSWTALPKYLPDGTPITYRGVEVIINGVDVHRVETAAVDTNDAYIVTYKYGEEETPAFANTLTVATNRMVYGFVNLSKKAAYLAANGIAEDGSLAGVQFDIYSGTGNDKTLYASGITTDASGNLTRNADGTYGTEHKHLISGTYTLMETVSSPGYSVWKDGVTFTVGVSGSGNTGEHGTAWISTSQIGSWVWRLKVEYKGFNGSSHHGYLDDCSPETSQDPAYNLESRGVIAFTKTGPQKADGTYTQLDTHTAASGESEAYFGVYLEEACATQVAGMTPADGTHFVLTNLAQDKSELTEKVEGVPYLRKYGSQYTLLSGTYYIRELTAPPGYKLDGTVRKAVIPPVKTPVSKDENSETELLNTFLNNKATIGPVREEQGSTAYNWPNEPNQLTLYKRDQYGRAVTLKDMASGEKGWLELTVQGDENKFPTGSATILLRQGEGIAPYVTYDGDHWTITGLFDIGRTYTIREPDESVPDSHIRAKDFSFTMNDDGSIAYVPAEGLTSTDKPLEEDGRSYENAFCANADCNVVVMRDVARFLTDVTLKKVIAGSNQPIPNISFRLYKYSTVDGQGNPTDAQPVLTNATSPRDYLTTDETGQIVLSGQPDGYGNQITGCKLRWGLDMGSYFFEEMERGASDKYRLVGRVFFTIAANNPENTNPTTQQGYESYARVIFGNGFSTASSGKTGVVENSPVPAKTLQLTKKNKEGEPLSGAKFTLTYQSINDGQTGAQPQETISCATGEGGALYRLDASGTLTVAKPDISRKGTYTLVETQAPEYYMTPTENGKLPVLLRFKVGSDHSVTVLQKHALVTIDLNGADILGVSVTNKRTAVAIAKRNDMENGTKTGDQKRLLGEPLPGASLELYEGVYDPTQTPVTNGTVISDANGNWSVEPGTLKENTLYTLHESQAPVGYLEAKDIYFKLFGTTTLGEGENQRVVSTLSVWNGTGNPDVDAEGWSQDNIRDAMLTMVDETIVVPVDLRKVLDQNGTYSNLPGAKFEIRSLDDNSVLGTAVTDQAGHLVWEEVTNPNKLVFESGRRLTTDNAGSAKGKAIFLGQNSGGYRLTESYAPDTVYNNGGFYTVKITAQNFRDYLADTSRKLNAVNGSMETVANGFGDGTAVVNLPYESTVTLHKYDLEDKTIAIAGAKFTLYHATVDGENWTRGEAVTDAIAPGGANGVFTTDPEGNLSIQIHRKGTYMLVETAAVPGYKLDGQNPPTFRITLTDAEYNTTQSVNETGVPNEKIHLTVTKVDSETGDKLPGVAFTLRPAEGSHFLESYVNSHPYDFSDGTFTLETGVEGTARIPGGLVQQGHSYILTETGLGLNTTYRLAEGENARQITFRVNEDGTMEITPNWMFRLADDDKTNLIVANEQIRLTVSKLDQTTGSGVAGAVLTLSRDGQVQGTLTTTDGLHSLTFTNLTPGRYQLAETTPPNGYNPITDPLVFDIDQSGKVTAAYIDRETDVSLAPAEGYALAGENFTISNPKDGETGGIELKVRNARYSDLQITKQGSDGAKLPSVVFRLDKADGTQIGQVTTNQEGVAAFTNLPDGDYRLTELKTAPGYNLLSVPLEIHIDRNSEIYRVTSNGMVISGSGLVRNGNTIEMTVINQKGLALPATGTTTPELPKAVLLMTAALEGLVLYFYQTHGKRRKKEN